MGAQAEEERLTEGSAVSKPRANARSAAPKAASARAETHAREDATDDREQERHDLMEVRTDLSDDERVELFRDSIMQSVLPDLPTMPGYHNVWLSTSNARDPVARRLMMGYELIRVADLPRDWQGASLKTGEYAGCVGINEMIAARIPDRLYKRYMYEAHERQPLEEEEKLKAAVQGIKNDAARRGMHVVEEGDGTADPVQRAGREPVFPA